MRGEQGHLDVQAMLLDRAGEGWLHSGDVGLFDQDGYLMLVDRW